MERSTDDARMTEDAPLEEPRPDVPSGDEAGTESGFDVPAGEGAAHTQGDGLVDVTADEGPDEEVPDFAPPSGAEEAVAEPEGPSETADVIEPEPAPPAPEAEAAGFDEGAITEAEPFPETEVEEPAPEATSGPAAEAVPEPSMDLPIEEPAPAEEELIEASVESAEVAEAHEPEEAAPAAAPP